MLISPRDSILAWPEEQHRVGPGAKHFVGDTSDKEPGRTASMGRHCHDLCAIGGRRVDDRSSGAFEHSYMDADPQVVFAPQAVGHLVEIFDPPFPGAGASCPASNEGDRNRRGQTDIRGRRDERLDDAKQQDLAREGLARVVTA